MTTQQATRAAHAAKAKSLVSKLAEVMAAIERVPKRGHNAFHKYDYATESDIVATVRQELAARHVMLFPAVTAERREPVGDKGSVLTTLTMVFRFVDGETGESLEFPWLGSGTDKEDKGVYKAMTGGEKYFLLKTFLMPTGDDPEQDDDKPQPARAQAPQPRKPEGFDQWLHDLESVADEGTPALLEMWRQSDQGLRRYLVTTNASKWDAIKAKAAKVAPAPVTR